MSTRRTHNKTRLGCGQCKKKRIKCDETHPACLNCQKKGLDCSFLLLAPSTRLSTNIAISPAKSPPPKADSPYQVQVFRRSPSSPKSSRSSSPRSPTSPSNQLAIFKPPPSIPPTIHFNDAFTDSLSGPTSSLLAQYRQTTALTLATDDPAKSAWQCHVPQLAQSHPFLIHGINSVTSLHLSCLYTDQPAERTKMATIAADQMNRALSHFRTELTNINKSNAPALFACATLTAVYFFRTSVADLEETQSSIPPDISDPPDSVVDKSIHSIIRTFWALRGALSVLTPGWAWVVDSELSPLCYRKWWPQHRVPANERALEEDRRLFQIERLWLHPGNGPKDHHDCLSAALSHLRSTYALVSMLTDPEGQYPPMSSPVPYSVDDTTVGTLRDRAAMLVWATRLSKEFIALVEAKNVEALVITAHYAVLLGRVRNVWWMDGLGKGMVRAIAMALGRGNLHLIEWPAQVLDVDVNKRFGLDGVKVNK